MVVNRHPDRLRLAEEIGAIPIDDSSTSPAEQVLEVAGAKASKPTAGASASATSPRGGQERTPGDGDGLAHPVRPATGGLGVIGVYPPADPGAARTS